MIWSLRGGGRGGRARCAVGSCFRGINTLPDHGGNGKTVSQQGKGGGDFGELRIQTAVRLLLPGELAKHAVSEGAKAVTKVSSSGTAFPFCEKKTAQQWEKRNGLTRKVVPSCLGPWAARFGQTGTLTRAQTELERVVV